MSLFFCSLHFPRIMKFVLLMFLMNCAEQMKKLEEEERAKEEAKAEELQRQLEENQAKTETGRYVYMCSDIWVT